MKKITIALTLLLSFNVYAKIDCKEISELATTIMTTRQAGISMVQMMGVEAMSGNKLAQHMVMESFEVPVFNTQRYQQIEINKFRDQYTSLCFKANMKEGE